MKEGFCEMTNLKVLETYARGGKKMRGRHRRLASGHLIDAAADAAGCRLCPQTEVSRAFLARTTSAPPPPPPPRHHNRLKHHHRAHHPCWTTTKHQCCSPITMSERHILMHDHLHRRNLSISFLDGKSGEPHEENTSH